MREPPPPKADEDDREPPAGVAPGHPQRPEAPGVGEPGAGAEPAAAAAESRRQQLRGRAVRIRLYGWTFTAAAALIVVVALVVANTRHVEVSWVFGSGRVSLVWLLLWTAVVAWLLGIATGALVRRRARRRRPRRGSEQG